MKSVTVPREMSLYPALSAREAVDVRMKLGAAPLSLNSREIPGPFPVLLVDFFNDKGKLYALRYNLPPDTAENTQRRTSLLLRLLSHELDARGVTAV